VSVRRPGQSPVERTRRIEERLRQGHYVGPQLADRKPLDILEPLAEVSEYTHTASQTQPSRAGASGILSPSLLRGVESACLDREEVWPRRDRWCCAWASRTEHSQATTWICRQYPAHTNRGGGRGDGCHGSCRGGRACGCQAAGGARCAALAFKLSAKSPLRKVVGSTVERHLLGSPRAVWGSHFERLDTTEVRGTRSSAEKAQDAPPVLRTTGLRCVQLQPTLLGAGRHGGGGWRGPCGQCRSRRGAWWWGKGKQGGPSQ